MKTSTFITEAEFRSRIDKKDGDFKGLLFEFPVNLSQHFDFSLDFSGCTFSEDFSCVNSTFLEEVNFNESVFKQDSDFSLATFIHRTHFDGAKLYGTSTFKRTNFQRMVHFIGTYFHGDAFFERTFFTKEVLFIKSHFLRDVYFHKTFFGMRADFSYAAFADLYVSSFFAIRSNYQRMDGSTMDSLPPRLVFRYVFFPRKTMFTNVDLSRVIFQNSMLEQIIFKDCRFSDKDGRNCFYAEIAKSIDIQVSQEHYQELSKEIIHIHYCLNDNRESNINIGDHLIFINSENTSQKYKTFITERHTAKDWDSLFLKLELVNPYRDYQVIKESLDQAYTEQEIEEHGVVAYGFKRFDDEKHWENLEDMNRQMKKSLEDSKDWQRAGDFYRGEMEAVIELMKIKKEKPVYRSALALYGVVSGFCESVVRIFLFMGISFGIYLIVLSQFRSDLSFIQLFEYSLGFFIPLLGRDAVSLRSLDLLPWQNIVLMIGILWFYLLWFFLALTLQRKFRR